MRYWLLLLGLLVSLLALYGASFTQAAREKAVTPTDSHKGGRQQPAAKASGSSKQQVSSHSSSKQAAPVKSALSAHTEGSIQDNNNNNNNNNIDVKKQQQQQQHKKTDKRLSEWLREQKQAKQDVIELVSADMLELMLEHLDHLVVFFYEPSSCLETGKKASARDKCKRILQELENIDDETDEAGIQFVKCEDAAYARSLAINSLPALVYFEAQSAAPSIYQGDLEQEELVLEWLVKQKEDDTIENINRDILASMLEASSSPGRARAHSYIACLFYRPEEAESERILERLESIDDDLAELGVQLVKLSDDLIAKKYGVRKPPGLVLFRHGEPLKYQGDLSNPNELLDWLTHPENLESKDSIESLNEKMFLRFLRETDQLAVLFYSDSTSTCKQCPRVLEELETIDDDLSELGLRFVKVESQSLARTYGVHALPALVYLSRGANSTPGTGSSKQQQQHSATIYAGDLKKGSDILEWLTELRSPHLHLIPDLTARQVRELIKSSQHLAVYVYSENAPKSKAKAPTIKVDDDEDEEEEEDDDEVDDKHDDGDLEDDDDDDDDDNDDDDDDDDDEDDDDDDDVLTGLENIDSECRRQNIEFVKTKDKSFIKEFGLDDDSRVDNDDGGDDEDDGNLPALVYFEHGQLSIYEGNLAAEEDLLDWLLRQRREDTIEQVNRRLLERLIESSHYLVVLFYKTTQCKSCQAVLDTLEKIDDDCDAYGIAMVKINDMPLAKRYGIKTFPALVYFRNGNPLVYAGDLRDEGQVLDWLLDDDQRELTDEIEDINGRMLDKLIDSSPFLAALFYDSDCSICPKVLHELEKIDDDTDLFGIDFVKINDFQAARKYNVHSFPTLVYFRKQTPSYYDGDLLDEERVLTWLTSNDVFELEDEIEEVNKKMLDKLVETSDYIAVLFYEKNCKHCEEVLKELEHIDDEADALDIMFVKIRDMNYAKKFGITQAPSLVYFRKKFPSIYRGDLMKEEKVLEWLRKNRYRNPELNLFMYALFSITMSFIVYTVFLMFCAKKKQD